MLAVFKTAAKVGSIICTIILVGVDVAGLVNNKVETNGNESTES
jgi:hypothetical protein